MNDDQSRNGDKKQCQIVAIANQKGGVGKTTTCANLGFGLAQEGKRVLLIDADPQASLTISLGHHNPDAMPVTLASVLGYVLVSKEPSLGHGILEHPEGVHLMPSNIELSGMDITLVNAMSRETILKQYLHPLKEKYDYILIDCMPSLGMMTINALTAANSVIIPVQSHYLSAKGLEQLLSTINKVKRNLNPKLKIEGILLTMVDSRTNFDKEIVTLIKRTYGSRLPIFDKMIPKTVRVAEMAASGQSIYAFAPNSKAAEAYKGLTKEVLKHGEQPNRRKGYER